MAPHESALSTSTSSVPFTRGSASVVVPTRVSPESLGRSSGAGRRGSSTDLVRGRAPGRRHDRVRIVQQRAGLRGAASKLIIIGIGVSAICKALTNILIINGPVIFIKEATTWITGTIYGSNWNH